MEKMRSGKGPSHNPTGLKSTFRALSHRNYRLFFVGQGISLIGTWMQQIAMSWLVYDLTHSAFMLGLIGFMGSISTFILAPLTGVWADRWPLRKALVVTQILAMVQALILAFLTLEGLITIPHLLVLSVVLGLVNAFDMPIRQSFVVEMVGKKEDLGNAIALNSSLVNSARLFGPAIAGILIAVVGEGICFLLNGLSYLAVIASLLAMKIPPLPKKKQTIRVWQGLKDGFSYTFGFPPIRSILLLLALVSLMGMPYTTLMPVFAKDILHGGPHTLGFLVGCSGVGALAGAVYLASRKSVLGLGRIMVMASSVFGMGLIAFSLSRISWLSFGLMVLTGFGMMVQMTSSNTVIQTIVEDNKRGRVMSFYSMAIRGMTPFGSLLAGSMASHFGAPTTLLFGGAVCISGALLFDRRLPSLRAIGRPIYIKKEIIKE
jgi:MFS family permease